VDTVGALLFGTIANCGSELDDGGLGFLEACSRDRVVDSSEVTIAAYL
jgi:hypothetical protein